MAVAGFDHERLEREASVGALFLFFSFTFVALLILLFVCFFFPYDFPLYLLQTFH